MRKGRKQANPHFTVVKTTEEEWATFSFLILYYRFVLLFFFFSSKHYVLTQHASLEPDPDFFSLKFKLTHSKLKRYTMKFDRICSCPLHRLL